MMPFDPVGSIRAVVAALMMMFCAGDTTLGHDWYPKDCCGGHKQDCRPISCAELDITSSGRVSWHGVEIPRRRQGQYHEFTSVGVSPDNACHICVNAGYPMCVFIPLKSS